MFRFNNGKKVNDSEIALQADMRKQEAHYCYRYPHPAVTVDCVIFGFDGDSLRVLLIERGIKPYKGMWALPGGFVNIDETVEQAAARELQEETSLSGIFMEQFKTFSAVKRDPRERVISVAFIALVRQEALRVAGGDDAVDARWFDIEAIPPLAFDHDAILTEAYSYLREILRIKPVAFSLLDELFTISELQKVYEIINGTTYDRRNFQRKLIQADIVEERGVAKSSGPSRPPKLFSLKGRVQRMLNRDNDLLSTGAVPEVPAPDDADLFSGPGTDELFGAAEPQEEYRGTIAENETPPASRFNLEHDEDAEPKFNLMREESLNLIEQPEEEDISADKDSTRHLFNF